MSDLRKVTVVCESGEVKYVLDTANKELTVYVGDGLRHAPNSSLSSNIERGHKSWSMLFDDDCSVCGKILGNICWRCA